MRDPNTQPGRRRRRRASRRKRIVRAIEPFALLGGLAVLSLGVIHIVERGVPSKASYVDRVRFERARVLASEQGIDYSLAFDDHWIPEHADDDPLFLDTPLPTEFADPLADPPPLAAPSRGAVETDASGAPMKDSGGSGEAEQAVDATAGASGARF